MELQQPTNTPADIMTDGQDTVVVRRAATASLVSRFESAVSQKSLLHPRPPGAVLLQYGTSGFRTEAGLLDHVLFRMGLMAVLMSAKAGGAAVGLVVTASHNPEPDNGVKLVDTAGETLMSAAWERHAARLANAVQGEGLMAALREVAEDEDIAEIDGASPPRVLLGRDTRSSGAALQRAARDGVLALGGAVSDYGLVTTPQLHYMVRCVNTCGAYGEATAQGYHRKLCRAFLRMVGRGGRPRPDEQKCLWLDGANGVGARAVREMSETQPGLAEELRISLVNDSSTGRLNHRCGADYVATERRWPEGLPPAPLAGHRCCSLDGDADRLVYYYGDAAGRLRLLDGDKMAVLICDFLKGLLARAGLLGGRGGGDDDEGLEVGVVQTAYANGASTRYLRDGLGVTVRCVATGVKHLHRAARGFNVGVYFEANGHGTVLFSPRAEERIRRLAAEAEAEEEDPDSGPRDLKTAAGGPQDYVDPTRGPKDRVDPARDPQDLEDLARGPQDLIDPTRGPHDLEDPTTAPQDLKEPATGAQDLGTAATAVPSSFQILPSSSYSASERREAALLLRDAVELVNQTVGDAISTLLLVEAVLALRGATAEQWDGAYGELPSRQLKVAVAERGAVRSADDGDEQRAASPPGLQEAIDGLVERYGGVAARCFARASGTEDVVRVYAEAETREAADDLAHRAALAVYRLAGGVGDEPRAPPPPPPVLTVAQEVERDM